MANFYISDLHIGHENILRFDNRPFADVNEMNNKLIENWNARVHSNDTVYILGDFIWAKESAWPSIVGSLAGNKVLIRGNGNSQKGYWAVAGSGILAHTITNTRLAAAGYFEILNYYESLHLCD